MKIELLMKVIEKPSEEDEAERIAKKLISGEEEDSYTFTYKPYTLDLNDISTFGAEDDDHIKILMPFGMFFAKINYYLFRDIYEASLRVHISEPSDFKFIKK